ncbi:MAG: 2-succinyl-5-enolpyruvyl-6-hydroxy-3-cyclohexene-1-carboxylic-acid synthase [Bacteroidota bacterium]
MNQIISAIPLAQTIVESLARLQIQHVVISPGSRNAPLTMSFTNHPSIKTYSIVDERVAGFFAMGMAQQLQQPVTVVCTSGSALLNYYPAVAEAFYSDIPLLIISADRPKHLIDVGDGQTIRQENVLQNHVLYSACLKEDVRDKSNKTVQKKNEKELSKALAACLYQNGPVHINAPFDEPLYEQSTALNVNLDFLAEIVPPDFPDFKSDNFIEDWNSAKKKMILVGVNQPNQLSEKVINLLAKDPSVLVLTESTSNLRHQDFVASIDGVVAPIEKLKDKQQWLEKFAPDMLISFGGMVVSKKIKAILRQFSPQKHYHIDAKKVYDTFFCLTSHIQTKPNVFFEYIFDSLEIVASEYRDFWLQINQKRNQSRSRYLKQIPFSDLKVFEHIFDAIPRNQQIQLGNSSTIRYANLFDFKAGQEVFCNRGTSGIDGSTSTAIGAALANDKPTTFITGDLSFLYDSNALWNAYTPKNFKMIIVNNQGGGIFRILPGEKNKTYYNTYFETTHQLDAKHLAKMYNWNYASAKNENDLIEQLKLFYNEEKSVPSILEIFTPRTVNDEVLLGYFQFLASD